MATVRVRIVILTVRITLCVCPFNRMAHTANSDDAREEGVPKRYKECLSMFILLSDTCIKNKLSQDYRAKLHLGTF